MRIKTDIWEKTSAENLKEAYKIMLETSLLNIILVSVSLLLKQNPAIILLIINIMTSIIGIIIMISYKKYKKQQEENNEDDEDD